MQREEPRRCLLPPAPRRRVPADRWRLEEFYWGLKGFQLPVCGTGRVLRVCAAGLCVIFLMNGPEKLLFVLFCFSSVLEEKEPTVRWRAGISCEPF